MSHGIALSCVLQKDGHPAYFFLCSAQAAIERRKASQKASDLREGAPPTPLPDSPVQGQYLGQLAIPTSQRRLTEEEFVQFLEVQSGQICVMNRSSKVSSARLCPSVLQHLSQVLHDIMLFEFEVSINSHWSTKAACHAFSQLESLAPVCRTRRLRPRIQSLHWRL